MNPLDPTEHFYHCMECGLPVVGSQDHLECRIEEGNAGKGLIIGVALGAILWSLIGIIGWAIWKELHYGGWVR